MGVAKELFFALDGKLCLIVICVCLQALGKDLNECKVEDLMSVAGFYYLNRD